MKKLLNSLLTISLILLMSGCGIKEEVEPSNPTPEVDVDKPVIEEDNKEVVEKVKGYKEKLGDTSVTYVDSLSSKMGETFVYKDDLHKLVDTKLTKEESVEDKISYKSFMKDVNKRKEEFARENRSINSKSPNEYYGDSEYRKCIVDKEKVTVVSSSDGKLSQSQMIADLNEWEEVLRTYYGPYKYFTKERFKEAYEVALSEIKKYDSLDYDEFETLLRDAYYFIQDCHFRLGYGDLKSLRENRTDGYYYDDYYFLKDSKGYYLKDYSPKTYLTMFNDDTKIDKYMHYGVEDSGEIAYMLSTTLPEIHDGIVRVVIGDTPMSLYLKQMDGLYKYLDGDGKINQAWTRDMDSFISIDGYPVVTMRVYSRRNGYTPDFNRYSDIGQALKKENIVIHDTRSNGGGNSMNQDGFIGAIDMLPFAPQIAESDENFLIYNGHHNQKVAYPCEVVIDNDNQMFTLTDASSGSCGDGVALVALQTRNNVLVGEPTSGTMLAGNTHNGDLKYSGISYACGTHIKYEYGLDHLPDGYGLEPDLWIKSSEALDRTVKMLEFYDIKPSSTSEKIVEDYGYNENYARFDIDEYSKTRTDKLYKSINLSFNLKDIAGVKYFTPVVKEYFDGEVVNTINDKTKMISSLESTTDNGINYYKYEDNLRFKVNYLDYEKEVVLSSEILNCNDEYYISLLSSLDKTSKEYSDTIKAYYEYLLNKVNSLGSKDLNEFKSLVDEDNVHYYDDLLYRLYKNAKISYNSKEYAYLCSKGYKELVQYRSLYYKKPDLNDKIGKFEVFMSNSSEISDGGSREVNADKPIWIHVRANNFSDYDYYEFILTFKDCSLNIGREVSKERPFKSIEISKLDFDKYFGAKLELEPILEVRHDNEKLYQTNNFDKIHLKIDLGIEIEVFMSNNSDPSNGAHADGITKDGVEYVDTTKPVYLHAVSNNNGPLRRYRIFIKFKDLSMRYGAGFGRGNSQTSWEISPEEMTKLFKHKEYTPEILICDENEKELEVRQGDLIRLD